MRCEPPYEEITIPGTTITSPGYPLTYGESNLCQVTLTFDGRVSINFVDFNLQSDSSCQYDWLEVRDGNSSESELLGDKLCGDDIPGPIESTGRSVTLVFKSDASYNFDNTGFKIVAESISN